MSSFPLTNSIIFQDGHIAPPTSIDRSSHSNLHLQCVPIPLVRSKWLLHHQPGVLLFFPVIKVESHWYSCWAALPCRRWYKKERPSKRPWRKSLAAALPAWAARCCEGRLGHLVKSCEVCRGMDQDQNCIYIYIHINMILLYYINSFWCAICIYNIFENWCLILRIIYILRITSFSRIWGGHG